MTRKGRLANRCNVESNPVESENSTMEKNVPTTDKSSENEKVHDDVSRPLRSRRRHITNTFDAESPECPNIYAPSLQTDYILNRETCDSKSFIDSCVTHSGAHHHSVSSLPQPFLCFISSFLSG